MVDDQYDYYLYTLRKTNLAAFEGLMKFNNNELFRFKHLVKAATGICKLHLRIQKVKDQESARFYPLFEEYKSSDEFKKSATPPTVDAPEEEENKKDTDPKGFSKYNDLVSKTTLICYS